MRHGIKILGLTLLAAISMMAVTATAAHAVGELRVEGTGVLGKGVVAEAEGTSTEGGKLVVSKLGITINCPKATLTGSGGNLTQLHGEITATFLECKVEGTGSTCTIYPTEADLENETNKQKIFAKALILWLSRLAGVKDHYRLSNAEGKTNFTEWFYGGATCTLPEVTEVNGVGVAASDSKPTEELLEHELNDVPAADETALKTAGMTDIGLFYGKEVAEVVGGKVKGKLTGKFAGKKFSVN